MGQKRVEVYKDRRNSGCWLALIPLVALCFGAIMCVGAITAGLAAGLIRDVEVVQETFTEARDGAETAQIEIETGVASVNINALQDTDNLFVGDITYYGEVDFTTGGAEDRIVRLQQVDTEENIFGIFDFLNVSSRDDIIWDIGLAQDIPIDLLISAGVQDTTLDLSGLILSNVSLDLGVGEVDLTLPRPNTSYNVDINSGVGGITVDLPEGIAVRIEVTQGVGDVNVSGLDQISADEDNPASESGVWESADYNDAETRITITIDGGVGDITVRR